MGESCPICGCRLYVVERVREERVPGTVPDYFSRAREAPYRRTDQYEVVKCSNEHTFKRRGTSLTGMAVFI